jgi:integrase
MRKVTGKNLTIQFKFSPSFLTGNFFGYSRPQKARLPTFLSKHSNGTYYLWFDNEHGKRQKVSTHCKCKTDAVRFLQSFRKDEYERAKRAKKKQAAVFIKEFLEYAKGNFADRTLIIYRSTLKHFISIIGDLPLLSITPQHFDAYKTERLKTTKLRSKDTVKPVTVNIELRALRACFNTAYRWKLIPINPFAGQKLVPVPEHLPVFFSKSDFRNLLAVIKEGWLRDTVVFATLTGLRRGEIVNLRWQDVDLKRRVIQIQSNPTFKTKQGQKRVIPLNDTAFYLLQAKHGKDTSEYIFTLNGKKIFDSWLTHAFKQAVKDAKLQDGRLHFHSLRHTFASWLVQDGVSLYEVQKLLGHSSSSTTEFYSHLLPEQLHSTVNRISIDLN